MVTNRRQDCLEPESRCDAKNDVALASPIFTGNMVAPCDVRDSLSTCPRCLWVRTSKETKMADKFSFRKQRTPKIFVQKDTQKQCTIFRKSGCIREKKKMENIQIQLKLNSNLLSQRVFQASSFWQWLSFLYHRQQDSLNTSFKHSNLEDVHPGDGCTTYSAVHARLRHLVS